MGSARQPKKGGLPVHPSVSEVLNEFVSVKGSSPLENYLLKDMTEVVSNISRKRNIDSEYGGMEQGLSTYFDKALGMMLLYEEERGEYKEYRAQHPTVRMSHVYGTPHLLRLLVKLPLLLNQVVPHIVLLLTRVLA